MSVLDLARPELRRRMAYQTADASRDYVRLHANESPWALGDNNYNRYPDPYARELKARLANLYSVGQDQILPTRGSDDGIDLVVRGFCRANRDAVVLCPPTFGMYKSFAEIQGAKIIEVPLVGEDYQLDLAGIKDLATTPKIIFLCSPNNPTGNLFPLDHIKSLCAATTSKSLVVVDEAYIEFAASTSCGSLINNFENLAVLRTLSKAYGLAGLRSGAVIATPAVVELLSSIMTPYAIPTPCLTTAMETLDQHGAAQVQARVALIQSERVRMTSELERRPAVVRVAPSVTNFLLVTFKDSEEVYRTCLNNGVLVRDFSKNPGLQNCLRITVSEAKENNLVLSIISEVAI